MTVRVTSHTVVIHRDGKNVRVPPHQAFDFTDAEIADIRKMHPTALRRPVKEDPAPVAEEPEVTSTTQSTRSAAPRKGKAAPPPAETTEVEEDDDQL